MGTLPAEFKVYRMEGEERGAQVGSSHDEVSAITIASAFYIARQDFSAADNLVVAVFVGDELVASIGAV